MKTDPKTQEKNPLFTKMSSSSIAVAIKFSVIAAAVILFFLQDLNLVFNNALSDEATYHILAIPFIFGYLMYRKRKMVNATFLQKNLTANFFHNNFNILAGSLLCATAALTYWYGSYTFTPLEYHMLTLPIFAAGLVLVFFNTQTLRQMIFPIAFLIFLTPPPTQILYSVGSTLSTWSATASNSLANIFGMASTLTAQYGSPTITLTRPDHSVMNFSVDVACSGIYSLIGFAIFAIFIAYITKGKLRNKLAILMMGIPLIIALNIIRLTTILALGFNFGDEIALQVFHTIGATVLMFIGTLILLAVTEKAFKKPIEPPPCPNCQNPKLNIQSESCTECGKLRRYPKNKLTKTDIAKIASIAIILVVLLSIQAPVFALTQGPAEVLTQTPQGTQPNTQAIPLPQITGYNVTYAYRDTGFEQQSGEDASLVYAYTPVDAANDTVWVALEIASTTGPLHAWETCLVNYPVSQGWQPTVTQLELTDIQLQQNPPIVGRFFAFQYHDTGQTQAVLYWYSTATFQVNGTSQQKQIKMSLVIYPQSPQNIQATENQLLPIAAAINGYWQPIQTWSIIALAISQNGLTLAAATTITLAALMIYLTFLTQQETTSLRRLYAKLPEQNQLLIGAVNNAQKQGTSTTSAIAKELEKLTTEKPNQTWLNQKLQEAQNVGLLKKNTTSKDDKPIIQWENQVSRERSILKRLSSPFF